jgi:hypothetical protein
MALHLIISGLLKLLGSDFISDFLNFSVQLLNFAVLLSYHINFFIYCRMSRAFRDAFTQLLCPSIHRLREERIPSTAALPQLSIKPSTNNNNNNHHFELNDTSIVMKNDEIEILPSSTVILNATTAETPMSSTPPKTLRHMNNDKKKNPIVSFGKQRVVFRDDVDTSTNTRYTDL